MPFKPMATKKFQKWVKSFGWTLKKAGIDWVVFDQNGNNVCTITLQHPGEDVVKALSVKNFQNHLKERGLPYERPF